MVTLYGLKNCDSCRKALKWFEAQGIDARLRDVRQQPLDQDRLQQFITSLGMEKLINKRGTTWRQLPEHAQVIETEAAAIELLLQHPAIMKRPVIESGERLLLGFDKSVQEAFC